MVPSLSHLRSCILDFFVRSLDLLGLAVLLQPLRHHRVVIKTQLRISMLTNPRLEVCIYSRVTTRQDALTSSLLQLAF
jgi:hypothetical protein